MERHACRETASEARRKRTPDTFPDPPMPRILFIVGITLVLAQPAWPQPTFKLGVDAHVFPTATLKVEGLRLTRSTVKDDPGFKLQFHILKDGKSLQIVNARASESVDLPNK